MSQVGQDRPSEFLGAKIRGGLVVRGQQALLHQGLHQKEPVPSPEGRILFSQLGRRVKIELIPEIQVPALPVTRQGGEVMGGGASEGLAGIIPRSSKVMVSFAFSFEVLTRSPS